jgi:hypothetical protein
MSIGIIVQGTSKCFVRDVSNGMSLLELLLYRWAAIFMLLLRSHEHLNLLITTLMHRRLPRPTQSHGGVAKYSIGNLALEELPRPFPVPVTGPAELAAHFHLLSTQILV